MTEGKWWLPNGNIVVFVFYNILFTCSVPSNLYEHFINGKQKGKDNWFCVISDLSDHNKDEDHYYWETRFQSLFPHPPYFPSSAFSLPHPSKFITCYLLVCVYTCVLVPQSIHKGQRTTWRSFFSSTMYITGYLYWLSRLSWSYSFFLSGN